MGGQLPGVEGGLCPCVLPELVLAVGAPLEVIVHVGALFRRCLSIEVVHPLFIRGVVHGQGSWGESSVWFWEAWWYDVLVILERR